MSKRFFLQHSLEYTTNEDKNNLITLDEVFAHYCYLESNEVRHNPFLNSLSLKRILFSSLSNEMIVKLYQKTKNEDLNNETDREQHTVYVEMWNETSLKNKIQFIED